MKKSIQLAILLFISSIAISQTKLNLKINHKLGANAFAYNSQTTNNLGNSLDFVRLEYYLTVVSITHDGGTVTPINRVFLVNAGTTLLDSLTTLNITTLEKVTIAVGVDPSLNHLDPSVLSSANPLSPKSPSMHWGWTPGYRFTAIEGTSFGITPNRVFEIHSLGDVSYFYSTINTAGISGTGEKTIELNADYLESIRDIDVTNGPLIHGEAAINKQNLENFRDYVFTSIEGNPSVGVKMEERETIDFTISPNPTTENDNITISFVKEYQNLSIVIIDMAGRVVLEQNINSTSIQLSNLSQGTYICSVKNGESYTLVSRKFIVNK